MSHKVAAGNKGRGCFLNNGYKKKKRKKEEIWSVVQIIGKKVQTFKLTFPDSHAKARGNRHAFESCEDPIAKSTTPISSSVLTHVKNGDVILMFLIS